MFYLCKETGNVYFKEQYLKRKKEFCKEVSNTR